MITKTRARRAKAQSTIPPQQELPAFPDQAKRVIEYEVEDEMALYDPEREVVHILNATAATVWHLCDGTRTPDAVLSDFARLYGKDRGEVSDDVRSVLSFLNNAALLVQP
jgi:hypothetical protein